MYRIIKHSFLALCSLLVAGSAPSFASTPTISAAEDSTGTVVTRTGNTFDITGGTPSKSFNLFHSFEQLNLESGQTANFLADPTIFNIIGRVVGEESSFINGSLNVDGINTNLYLISPAGIIFGPDARVSIPGSFTATTADAIELTSDAWFNANGLNDYDRLTGAVSNAFAFMSSEPNTVANFGSISSKGSVTLLGGRVINTGNIATPTGSINIAAVPGESLVRVDFGQSLLSIALPTEVRSELNTPVQSLSATAG